MAYSDKVLEHYENPRNVGTLDKNDESVGTGLVGAPACGDVMRLQLRITEDGVIEDAKFKTFGCGSAIASSSLVTEWVKGMSVDDASNIKNSQIAEELSLPPVKIHCSVLAEDAVKAAIADWKKKRDARKAATDAAPPQPKPPAPPQDDTGEPAPPEPPGIPPSPQPPQPLPPEFPAPPSSAEDGLTGTHAPSTPSPPANQPDEAAEPFDPNVKGLADADGC